MGCVGLLWYEALLSVGGWWPVRLFGAVEAGSRSMEEGCVYGRLVWKEEEGGLR